MTSENVKELDDPRITRLVHTQKVCSKHYNLRQVSSTRVQKCTQATSENDFSRTFAFVSIRANVKGIETLRCSATVQKTLVFCAQGTLDKHYRLGPMDWHTNSMPLAKELNPNECKKFIRTLDGMDIAEMIQYSQKRSFTYFENLRFPAQIRKKETPFTVTKLIIVHIIVLTLQPHYND